MLKTWLGLFIAFTIVFMDIGFLLNFQDTITLIPIPIFFTVLILPLSGLYFAVGKKQPEHISYSVLYSAIVTLLTSLLFYALFFMYITADKINFSLGHIIVLSASLILWVSIPMYRKFKIKSDRTNEYKISSCILVIPVVLSVTPILSKLLNGISDSFILTIAFLTLGGIWMLLSLIYWQNYYYEKNSN